MNKKVYNYIICTLIIAGMIFASELFNEKEIIFPEIAAICVGIFAAPQMPWSVNRAKMIVCILICSVMGICISQFLTLPIYIELIIAYVIGQIIFIFSKSTFAPMISAIVLPVLLQTTGIIYPIAAITLTIAISFFVKEKNDIILEKTTSKEKWIKLIIRSCIMVPIIIIAIKLNTKYLIAPPLLVAFTEMTNKNSKALKQPIKAITIVSLCALIGAALRWLLCMKFGLPLTIAGIVAVIVVLMLMNKMELYIPPAGAMSILAMLIPENNIVWYFPQVLIGISLLWCVAKSIIKTEELIQVKKLYIQSDK